MMVTNNKCAEFLQNFVTRLLKVAKVPAEQVDIDERFVKAVVGVIEIA